VCLIFDKVVLASGSLTSARATWDFHKHILGRDGIDGKDGPEVAAVQAAFYGINVVESWPANPQSAPPHPRDPAQDESARQVVDGSAHQQQQSRDQHDVAALFSVAVQQADEGQDLDDDGEEVDHGENSCGGR